MKKSRSQSSEHLLINNAIKNLDIKYYRLLKSHGLKLTDIEVKVAVLLKYEYSVEDIGVFMEIDELEIKSMIRSIMNKTGIENIKHLKNISINKGGKIK